MVLKGPPQRVNFANAVSQFFPNYDPQIAKLCSCSFPYYWICAFRPLPANSHEHRWQLKLARKRLMLVPTKAKFMMFTSTLKS